MTRALGIVAAMLAVVAGIILWANTLSTPETPTSTRSTVDAPTTPNQLTLDTDEAHRRASHEPASTAELEPAPPDPNANEAAVREFLAGLPRGDEILAKLMERGTDLGTLRIPPPFESVRQRLIDRFSLSESEWADAVQSTMDWPKEGLTVDWLERRAGLDPDVEPTEWQLRECEALAEAHNASIRDLAEQFVGGQESAYIQRAQRDEWEAYPYATPSGRPRSERPAQFASKAIASDGWCVRMSLSYESYPDLVAVGKHVSSLVAARNAALKAMVVQIESDHQGK